MTAPRFHATPADAVRERVRETVLLDGLTILLDRPSADHKLFDHPAVQAAYAADEYMPYWAELWPAARMLAKAVRREPWPAGEKPEALEVACGLGLVGIAALSCGLRVTFSDVDELAVRFAADNARLNGFTGFATAAIDLRSPPAGVTYPVILGSDLLYEPRLVEPVVAFVKAVLAPGGVCLIADPDRSSARPFGYALWAAGLTVEASFARAGEPGGDRTKGTVYRIRHRP